MRYLGSRSTARTRPRNLGLGVAIAAAFIWLPSARAADEARQTEVAKRGAQVMPFALKATTHIFTKADFGGTQRLVVKNAADLAQIKLIREHLRDMQARFERADFSGPSYIHGADMPGLAALKAAKLGAISYLCHDVDGGAELEFRTSDPTLVAAIHTWFDAQVSDHGADALDNHDEHRNHVPTN